MSMFMGQPWQEQEPFYHYDGPWLDEEDKKKVQEIVMAPILAPYRLYERWIQSTERLREAQLERQAMQAHIDELEQALKTANADSQEQTKELETSRAALVEAEAKCEKFEQENLELSENLMKSNEECEMLHNDIVAATQGKEKLEAGVKDLQEEVGDLAGEAKTQKAVIESQQALIKADKDAIKALEERLGLKIPNDPRTEKYRELVTAIAEKIDQNDDVEESDIRHLEAAYQDVGPRTHLAILKSLRTFTTAFDIALEKQMRKHEDKQAKGDIFDGREEYESKGFDLDTTWKRKLKLGLRNSLSAEDDTPRIKFVNYTPCPVIFKQAPEAFMQEIEQKKVRTIDADAHVDKVKVSAGALSAEVSGKVGVSGKFHREKVLKKHVLLQYESLGVVKPYAQNYSLKLGDSENQRFTFYARCGLHNYWVYTAPNIVPGSKMSIGRQAVEVTLSLMGKILQV